MWVAAIWAEKAKSVRPGIRFYCFGFYYLDRDVGIGNSTKRNGSLAICESPTIWAGKAKSVWPGIHSY